MRILTTLFLVAVFLFQSCQNKTEKKEPTATINNEKTTTSKEQSIQKGKKNNLPFDIEGKYRFEDDVANCKIELNIFFKDGQLKYKMQTNTQTFADKAKISRENGEYYITFQNIKWSENSGYIDPEGNIPEEDLPLPTEIMAAFRNNEIIFQNYGNAENHYMILNECDTKYIRLTKQKGIK